MPLSLGTIEAPYFPDLTEAVVNRVDQKFFAREIDPFHVYFAHGNYGQASRWVDQNPDSFPLIYLVMPFVEQTGRDANFYADVNCRIAIVVKTNAEYTQDERDALTIKPFLIPIYEELMLQIHLDHAFSTQSPERMKCDRMIRPYDGMGDVNGPTEHNLFKQKVDWMDIQNLSLKTRFIST